MASSLVGKMLLVGSVRFCVRNIVIFDLRSKLCKYADDIKIGRAVATEEDVQQLRADLKYLAKWAINWQMLFNVEKYVVMYIGANNNLYT